MACGTGPGPSYREEAVDTFGDELTITSSHETGFVGNWFYTHWKDAGTASQTLNSDGTFSISWQGGSYNYVGGPGWNNGLNSRVIGYNLSSDSGASYIALYGWSMSPLVEYYILQRWSYDPTSGATAGVTFTSNGVQYTAYRTQRVSKPSINGTQTFYQFWSKPSGQRPLNTNHEIKFADHAAAWAASGWTLGNMQTAGSDDPTYQVLAVEVFGPPSSGTAAGRVWDATPAAATCSDGIQNQSETGVDCGGPCSACSVVTSCGLPAIGTAGQAAPSGAVGGLQVLDWAGHAGAVSYTLDDSNSSQISNWSTIAALNVPMTWYMQTNKTEATNAVWSQAVAAGHEIGNHSHSHPTTASTADMDQAQSLIQSRFGVTAYTFAAPNGDASYQTPASTRFMISRGVANGLIYPNDSTNAYNLPTFIPASGAATSAFNAEVDAARTAHAWKTILVHGFTGGTDGAYQPVALANFTGAVNYAKGLGDMWLGTVRDVGAYWRGQKTFTSVTPTTSNGVTTYSWTLPANFPPGKCLRVKPTGGVVKQGNTVVPWNDRGYYEISLDAGSMTLSSAAAPTCSDGVQNQSETGVDCGGPCAACAAPTWSQVAVGTTSPAGSYTETSGTFSVKGAGADIYGTADAFHYVYKQVTGDATIIARATSLTNTNQWAKAGVMIRESLNAGSSFAMMQMRPDGYVQNQHRASTGASTGGAASTVGTAGAPKWLKVERSGNNFIMSYSSNGTTWTQAASQAITMGSTVYIGLVSCSHANGTLATAVFDNVSVVNPGACVPATTCSAGAVCGTQSNGCGGTISCGSCGSGYACDGSNSCQAVCVPDTCAELGAECGSMSDGCSGTLNCGGCGTYQACDANLCVTTCTPTTCSALGMQCGTTGDGCGGTLNCGSCAAGYACGANMCSCATVAAPTGASATAGTNQVTVGWSAVSGATNYTLMRSTTSGSGYTALPSTITGTSYVDTGLSSGTAYYYVVVANSSCGSSANSAQVTATPVAACVPTTCAAAGATCGSISDGCGGTLTCGTCGAGYTCGGTNSCQCSAVSAATGVTATAGNAQAVLSWSAVSGATSYDVKRSTTSGSGYATVATVTTTSYTNTGLTNGTTYYYVIVANSSCASSANSTQVSAAPAAASNCTCATGCSTVVTKTAPFVPADGLHEGCYFFSGSMGAYTNSWNLNATDQVNINGTNVKNVYTGSASYPAKKDNGYYLYYKSTNSYAHMEVK